MKCQLIEIVKHVSRHKRQVYLDHNATTSVSKPVRKKIRKVLKHAYGNPSSLYEKARYSKEIIEESRQQVAKAVHSNPEEIYFTGCATESNNAILKSLSNYFYPEKKKIISARTEHSSVINTLDYLQIQGIKVEYCPVDKYGRIIMTELEKLIDEDTFLICCMLANNEIGTIQDIRTISKIAAKHGILVMSDCVQALGKIPVSLQDLGVDFASFSAHKLHGPKGVGAMYIKKGSPFIPLIHGGYQEEGVRAGTESIHNIAGFGETCKQVNKLLEKSDYINNLKKELISILKDLYPDCTINSPDKNCIPNTINITFPGINNVALMALLDYHGIAVSGGSACSSHDDKPSHVLTAIGLSDQSAEETIRISLDSETSIKDIRYFINILHKYVNSDSLAVQLIAPEQLDKDFLFGKQTFILDVRPAFHRRTIKSLPNAHEVSFFLLRRYLRQLPNDKNIVVACQHGNLSYLATRFLISKGFKLTHSLSSGMVGWKQSFTELYTEFGGRNVVQLQPTG
jgi:cysteine desulfurase